VPTQPVIEQPLRMRPSDRYARRRRRYAFLVVGLAIGLVIGLLAGLMLGGPPRPPQAGAGGAAIMTRYQAVTLTNGQVFVGHLEKLDSAFPVLSDIHTLQSKPGEDGKVHVESLVVRRADEPDTMILNAGHILFVEPVRADSRLGKLIEEVRSRQ
jgi:hypothetical protein